MKILFGFLFVAFPFMAQANDYDYRITFESLMRSPACVDDVNCPAGSHCINGICRQRGTCSSDLDCGAGRHCLNHICK